MPRLGLPEYDWGTNCIHGVQSRCAPPDAATGAVRCPTSYPNPNMLGASFNRSAWRAMGRAIGVELRALWAQNVPENHKSELPHVGLDCWSPNINVARDPRWGRARDDRRGPAVNGAFGALYTRGLQTADDDERFLQAVVTLKHPPRRVETARARARASRAEARSLCSSLSSAPSPSPAQLLGRELPSNVSRATFDARAPYDAATTFFPAFAQAAVQQGGARGVMCSYNEYNGVPACATRGCCATCCGAAGASTAT